MADIQYARDDETAARFEEIAKLEDGWLDGEGIAPNERVIASARAVVSTLVAAGNSPPRIFPTAEGDVSAEWTFDTVEVSITFSSDASIFAQSVNVESGKVIESAFRTEQPVELAQFLSMRP